MTPIERALRDMPEHPLLTPQQFMILLCALFVCKKESILNEADF